MLIKHKALSKQVEAARMTHTSASALVQELSKRLLVPGSHVVRLELDRHGAHLPVIRIAVQNMGTHTLQVGDWIVLGARPGEFQVMTAEVFNVDYERE